MSGTIQTEHFVSALTTLLDEAFVSVQGIFLDRGTSMFETLATISAEEASIPVGGRCATLAAQVKHTAFYLDVVIENAQTGTYKPVDWDEIWRETGAVSAAEWDALKAGLRDSYERTRQLMSTNTTWSGDREIGGAMAMIVHTAYHLGEIRQALCTLKR
jgi:hypothetical protein